MANVVSDRIEFFSETHPEAQFKITLTPLQAYVDPYALERVLDNIISNAIKYSQPHPMITITVTDSSITIEDNGIGIENCSKIFERHYREIQGMQCAGGLGLGLSIVKKLCDQMGIDISLTSEHQQGSRFVLTFNNRSL